MSFGRFRLLVVKVKTDFFPVSCKSFLTFISFPQECHPELLITESKFLRPESLTELMKVVLFAYQI